MNHIFCDGAYRSDKKTSSIGIPSLNISRRINARNSYEAELIAVKTALEDNRVHNCFIRNDCKTLCKHLNNIESVRKSTIEKYNLYYILELLNKKNCKIQWVSRDNYGQRRAHEYAKWSLG